MANYAAKSKKDSTPLPLIGGPELHSMGKEHVLLTLNYHNGGKMLIWLDTPTRLALIDGLKMLENESL